jgi:hypothetical protein
MLDLASEFSRYCGVHPVTPDCSAVYIPAAAQKTRQPLKSGKQQSIQGQFNAVPDGLG